MLAFACGSCLWSESCWFKQSTSCHYTLLVKLAYTNTHAQNAQGLFFFLTGIVANMYVILKMIKVLLTLHSLELTQVSQTETNL